MTDPENHGRNRGSRVSGIDAAAGLVEMARRRLPEADLRVGRIETAALARRAFRPGDGL
jgi:hypothetical protein